MDPCYHGGGFWEDIGSGFETLENRHAVVNADVLDAWFPPAPGVIQALAEDLGWICRTSPPTHAEGLQAAIATNRQVPYVSVLPGAGSSSLIYLALFRWLEAGSKVLLIEPSYGEYEYLCRDVIGANVDKLVLGAESRFSLDLDEWGERVKLGRDDLAVLVNPNNPTGSLIPGRPLEEALQRISPLTKVLVDEAYINYCDNESVEAFAAASQNVFVVKSLSKGYALSGMRCAYLVGPPAEIRSLRTWSPPWAVSLPAQLAAFRALEDSCYYDRRYLETNRLRESLGNELSALGGAVQGNAGNWVLYRLPPQSPDASQFVAELRRAGVHVRDAGRTAPSLGNRYIRVAVKELDQQEKVVRAIANVVG